MRASVVRLFAFNKNHVHERLNISLNRISTTFPQETKSFTEFTHSKASCKPLLFKFQNIRCGSTSSSPSTETENALHSKAPKKVNHIWDFTSMVHDHKQAIQSIPGAFMASLTMDPYITESIYVTVNSVNECPYCEGLHGNLARMAGVDSEQLQKSTCVEESRRVVNEPAIAYARVFAENESNSAKVKDSFMQISNHYGLRFATQVQSLCWLLKWGSYGGNTINSIISGQYSKCFPNTLGFQAGFLLFYTPLFAPLAVLNKCLNFAPKVPKAVSSALGVGVVSICSIWITPLGLASIAAIKSGLVQKR